MLYVIDALIALANVATAGTYYADASYAFPRERETVVAVSTHREPWRDNGDCRFTGLMVPYVRDWTDVGTEHSPALTPEPTHVAGHAVVLNQVHCPGQPPQVILRVGSTQAKNLLGRWPQGGFVNTVDAREMRPGQLPPWLPQVAARIERLAGTDAAALAFWTASGAEVRRMLPEPSRPPEPAQDL